jgi:DNA polymerase elongation subunit (family B)
MTNIFPRNDNISLKDNKENIEYQIIDWFIPETDKKEKTETPDHYSMLIYGTNNENITICTKVVGYKPFFYVKPPETWLSITDKEFNNKINELNIKLIEEKYESSFKDKTTKKVNSYRRKIIPDEYQSHFEGLSMIKKKDFWGFTNNKIFRFIKVSTKSLYLYNNLKYYFMTLEKDGYKLYESNIDPFLKYIHIQKIKPCGWIKIKKYEIDDSLDTRCDYNIVANWEDIESINVNKIAPLLIASFDIECNSSHGDFPVACKNYKKLAQDLCLFAKFGYKYNKKNLIEYIKYAYTNDLIVDKDIDFKINRLYTKNSFNVKNLEVQLEKIIEEIILVLDKVKSLNINEDEEDDNDDEEKAISKISLKEYNDIEEKLIKILDRVLPKLEGDKIIQIGTTVHRYGSDEIIYKNIIVLNSCDKIENTDLIVCDTEKKLLMEWKNLMIKLNPDILIGYNICGFDMEYIWLRVIENDIKEDFSLGFGKSMNRKICLTEQKLASSAMGENILKSFDMDGTVIIDLFKVMQREQKLDSYKLDNVAAVFIGENKDDLKPNEIFQKFKGGSNDRCIIAKYCIQDCILVNKLLHKLKIIENNIGMGNVCLVPLNYLFRRGQGIKIFSLINNECMKKDFIIPVIKNFVREEFEKDDDGYEGAIVLEPKEGIYLNEPIVVFDYGSLYPSSMICRNLSHDTYVNNKKYLVDDPNVEFVSVKYDLYEGIGDKKVKTGVKDCIFAQYKDGKKGIIPEILNMLLDERKNTKKKIEYITITDKNNKVYTGFPEESENQITLYNVDTKEKFIINNNDILIKKETYNKFEKDVFDALQSAYKVTANSLYGQIGARTSPIYLKDIAACTTSTGREMIMIAKNFVETKYNAEVIYGDSVMPYTPIVVKNDNEIIITTFQDLKGVWSDYSQFKYGEDNRTNKEQFNPNNLKVWTNGNWSKINRIIRHKTIKKIYRILTSDGLVDVTEDHSLLNENMTIIKPSDCNIGTELLHSEPDIKMSNIINISNSYHNCYKTIDQLTAQKIFIYYKLKQYDVSISYDYKYYYISHSLIKNTFIHNYKIKKIDVLYEKYDGYVYDIETEEGVFHAGIGNIILKNTDSIFCKFPIQDVNGNQINGKEALSYAIEIGKNVEKNIVSILPKPQKLNYEKTFYPFILFSKKKYVGNLYETDINKYKQKSMGIVLKRRDNAQIVKNVYGGIINIILNTQDLNESVKFLKDELTDLINHKIDIKNLILSKTLRSTYKDPTKIAHKVLADRIGARDYGNKPAVNDRIQYIYIKVPNAKLQGDRIETPEFIKENNLTPDYLHYITNQIMKPVLQLYYLCMDQLPNYEKDENYWNNLEEELKLKNMYIDDKRRQNRITNLKLIYIQDLLFDEFISVLKEPKEKKTTKKNKIEEIKEEIKGDLNSVIKVVQNKESKNITLSVKVLNEDKVVWNYTNNENKDITKEVIIKNIIIKICKEFPKTNIKFNINYKKFIKDYLLILSKYNMLIKDFKPKNDDDDLFTQITEKNDVGKLKDVIEIIKYKDLLIIKDNIIIE